MSKEKVVLVVFRRSGHLCLVKWLQEEMEPLDVIAVLGNVGQEHDGLEKIKEKALSLGVVACEVVDMRQEFVDQYVSCAIAANAMYENKYPLLRPVSSADLRHLVQAAHK